MNETSIQQDSSGVSQMRAARKALYQIAQARELLESAQYELSKTAWGGVSGNDVLLDVGKWRDRLTDRINREVDSWQSV